MTREPLGIGVIGLGVMGRTHFKAYERAAREGLGCRVVAVCADDPRQLEGWAGTGGNIDAASPERLFTPGSVAAHATVEAMAGDPRVLAVSICTPTDTHATIASRMLRAGKHVLCEKPVALDSAAIEPLRSEARRSGLLCMPAMVMRFWPGWDWLKACVREQRYGRARSAFFQRLGARPGWSRDFYHDPKRTGGALVDLHIHDADAVLWLFGQPARVRAHGTIDHVTTVYHYDEGPASVIAEGGWMSADAFEFRMRYTVEFDRAVADWDLSRTGNELRVATASGVERVPLPTISAYDAEIAAFVGALASGERAPVAIEDAIAVARLLETERESLRRGQEVNCT